MSELITVYNRKYVPNTNGTSLKGYLNATYRDLVNVLGEPTFPEESGDGKVQVEWVVEFEGEIFTIYDWKTYDRQYTEYELDRFNIGGKEYAGDFIEYMESEIENYQP